MKTLGDKQPRGENITYAYCQTKNDETYKAAM